MTERRGEPEGRRRVLGAAVFAIAILGAGPATGAPGTNAASEAALPEVVVRVFEVRRVNSDFGPLVGLNFIVDTDGRRVPVSSWLATLARRIPDAFFAQLLTLTPAPGPTPGTREATARRGRRGVRARLRPANGGEEDGDENGVGAFEVEFTLFDESGREWTVRRTAAAPVGRTEVFSGRDFEITPSDYLSWFREPRSREERGRLYRRLRARTIFLALAVSRAPAPGEDGGRPPPIRLSPPDEPRLRELESPLVGAAAGTLRLAGRVDEEGALRDLQILESTFPEVAPRALGIVSGWRFPEAAGREARLDLHLESRAGRGGRTGAGAPFGRAPGL